MVIAATEQRVIVAPTELVLPATKLMSAAAKLMSAAAKHSAAARTASPSIHLPVMPACTVICRVSVPVGIVRLPSIIVMAADQKRQPNCQAKNGSCADVVIAVVTTIARHSWIPSHTVIVRKAWSERHVNRMGRVVPMSKWIPVCAGHRRIFQIAIFRDIQHGIIAPVDHIHVASTRSLEFHDAKAVRRKRDSDDFAFLIVKLVTSTVKQGPCNRDMLTLGDFTPTINIVLTLCVYRPNIRRRRNDQPHCRHHDRQC